jgi:putative ABC transport system permease protein
MNLWQDVRFALRTMWKSPRITATVLLTLALGIGANTAIFSVVNATLFRPLPFHDPEQLVVLHADLRGLGAQSVGFSVPEFDDLRDRAGVFSAVSVVYQGPGNLTGGEHPERLESGVVSPNYFSILGARPQLGRLFDPGDTASGFADAVVITDGLWRREFGGERSVLGHQMRLDTDLYTIVGVLPPDFRNPSSAGAVPVEIYVSAGFRGDPFPPAQRSARLLPGIIGRLKPGMTLAQAQAKLATFSDSLRRDYGSDYPAGSGWTLSVTPLKEVVVGNTRTLLISLLLAVAFILLIACVNVANLLLASASARQREIAVRLALGASRARIVRQLLTESAVLSLFSAAVGVTVATLGLQSLIALLPSQLPRLNDIHVDARVLAFSLTLSLLTSVLFGLVLAFQAGKVEPSLSGLRERGSSGSRHDSKVRQVLIGAEVALSLMLLVGAGVLLRTLWNLLQVNPGFNSEHLVAGGVSLPVPNDPKADIYGKLETRTALVRETVRRLRAVPGVENAALSSVVPLQGALLQSGYRVEGASESGDAPTAVSASVTPEFFRTIGAPLVRGRVIQDTDDKQAPLVVLVDEAAARHFWGAQDPLGKRIRSARIIRRGPPGWFTVVGVVGNVKLASLDEKDVPHVYTSLYQTPGYQTPGRNLGVLVRGTGDRAMLSRAVPREIQSVDPNLPVSPIVEMTELIRDGVGDRRFAASLLACFAVVALLLMSIGVYGVASYAIVRREKEISIRSALGATRGQLVQMVLREGMVPILVGLAVGVVGAALSGHLLAALLFQVRSTDASVFAAAGVTLVAIGILANYLPARRAGRVDPITALRTE